MHATAPRARPQRTVPRKIILVGNPNVGKSVLFGLLTGRYVTVSNYPGTTVEVAHGTARQIPGGDEPIRVIDTPGVNGLIPQSEDEKVTRDILLREAEAGDAIVLQVGDSKNLSRVLLLTLQLAEMGIPLLVCLNMRDEADSRGISIDAEALSGLLGVDVVPTVATRRQGLVRLRQALLRARPSRLGPACVPYGDPIEKPIAAIEPLLAQAGVSARALALMALAGDETLGGWLAQRLDPHALAKLERSRRQVQRACGEPPALVITRLRMKAACELAGTVTRARPAAATAPGRAGRILELLGAASMHPLLGVGVLGAVLYLIYLFVGLFGAGTAVDWLETGLFGKDLARLELALGEDGLLEPAAGPPGHDHRLTLLGSSRLPDGSLEIAVLAEARSSEPDAGWAAWRGEAPSFFSLPPSGRFGPARAEGAGVYRTTYRPGPVPAARIEVHQWSGHINRRLHALFMKHVPWGIVRDAFVGPYGLVTMGVTYAIAIVLPIVATFFFAFSILEDSGYLPRLAIMLNRAFRVIGLNGKAVLPMVLGLGCDTMATLTTRILPTAKERTIAIMLLALGVPCSAQLGVILGMLAALSWKATLIWAGAVTGVIMLVGFLASAILPGRRSDFILEIPPIRVPALGNIATKTLARLEWYLREAMPLFLLGTLVLFIADRIRLLSVLERAFSPLITGVLGLPEQATEAFLVGFLRRDFGSAGLYRLAEAGRLDPVQIVVALITMTLFIPCIANLFMIIKEKGLRVAAAVALFIFPFAILVGGMFNVALRATGVLS